MEDEASSLSPPPLKDRPSLVDMVVQRLLTRGVPAHYLQDVEMGLVRFLQENKGYLQDIVKVLMLGVEDAQLPGVDESKGAWHEYKQGCKEGIRWAQWLMFGGDPEVIMKGIQQETGSVRGVCGAVWGNNDIAYRCRTCENDPTCAICVSCFEFGNHANHDYSMIHTGGGCCDCGDITAWKESGFCSRHRGPGQAQSLPDELVSMFEPVMDALLHEWVERLQAAARVSGILPKKWSEQTVEERVATQTSLALVEMLLSFCNCSESLLTFTGELMASERVGLLDLLLTSERFLPVKVLNKLHELLFKLMGNPNFKSQFAKVFIHHYPGLVRDGLKQNIDATNVARVRENTTLSSFSVQIFTVPTLIPQLVVESKLLDMLLEALKDVFLSSSGGDGQQLASKGFGATSFYYRIIDDIRFVLRHPEVANYVARERVDLLKAWLHLLAFTQGVDSQRRQTDMHVEEETENWFTAYVLEVQMASIHPLLIDGAAKVDSFIRVDKSSTYSWHADEGVAHGHAKIGRISMESDVSGKGGTSTSLVHMDIDSGLVDHRISHAPTHARVTGVPSVLLWLISECAKVLDLWFLLDAYREKTKSSWSSAQRGNRRRGVHLRGRGARGFVRGASAADLGNLDYPVLDAEAPATREANFREWLRSNRQHDTGAVRDPAGVDLLCQDAEVLGVSDEDGSQNWWMGPQLPDSIASADFLRTDKEWLDIEFDCARQEVSLHIPLHRFLAVALQKSLETSPDLNQKEGNKRSWHCLITERGFLLQLFPPCYQVPAFTSLLMEHPLRIQVFCAQVRAGMWRKNGHSVQALCEHYHSVRWCEGSLDLDLFLLQCCGVVAPPEDFVDRIISRFGLADYFSLFVLRPNEYETVLAQHMLALLIRIVVERGFCGFSSSQSCRRELIKRLAVSDATHSQLMKALPPRLHEDMTLLQEALLSVATYYKPSGMQQGRFSLREECWKELDLYHLRWNARELQSAEDRYLHACKTSSVIKQLPKWQKPFAPFHNLSKLATCRRVHDVLRSIFFHAAFSEKMSESRAPENVLITALHLLALGLDVCSLFAYKKGWEFKSNDSSSSSIQDAQEPPPLLSNAMEKVYVGVADGTDISNRQSLLSLLVLLMRRYGGTEAQVASGESHQGSIGALIKSLLEEFSQLHSGCMYEIEALAPEILHRVSSQEEKFVIGTNAEEFSQSEALRRRLLARERQAAVLEKMKAAQEKFVASFESSLDANNERPEKESSGPQQVSESGSHSDYCPQSVVTIPCALCRDTTTKSPMSFLTFVQRSRLLEITEKGAPSWDKKNKSKSSEDGILCKGVESGSTAGNVELQESPIRVELLNLIQMALNGEVDQEGPIEVAALLDIIGEERFTDAIEGSPFSTDARVSETISSDSGNDDSTEEETCDISSNSFVDYQGVSTTKDEATEDEDEKNGTRESCMIAVLLEYVNLLSKGRAQHQQQVETESSASSLTQQRLGLSRLSSTNAAEGLVHDYLGPNDSVGVHMSFCGHAVHQECLIRYLSSLRQRYDNRTLFEGLQIVDPKKGEFLCPVCRRLANAVLPYFAESSIPGAVCKESCGSTSASVLQVPHALHLLQNAEELVWKPGFRKAVSKPMSRTLRLAFDSLFETLYRLYFPKDSKSKKNDHHIGQSLLLWDVVRYTMMAAELATRTRENTPSLDLLLKASDEGSVLPVLLRAARAIQNQSRQSVLLRARGVQLLVGSVCFGLSKDVIAASSMPGSVLKILHFIDNGGETGDIRLWRRAADPVLAHDPFSSLFWVIFCLPLSFPSSTEPFISLVHLFYLVCVTQIIASMGDTVRSNLLELQLSLSASAFLQNILMILVGAPLFQAPNEETSTDVASGSLLVTIHRFTLPYLRRCALLGKLLCNLSFEDEVLKSQDGATANKAVEWGNTHGDLKDLQILERNFGLPPLQSILEAEGIQQVILRWCRHLSKESGSRKLLVVPRPVMATPFKLMQLPRLYQTLLQRYIKERCRVCSTVPEQPALCLLCGTLCCGLGRRSSSNRLSECYRHALTCNGGVGVYLMIKKSNILLQRCARQASWPSPYLDSFGEEDIDMHRGKPLYLNEERYAALTEMVVSHGLDHNSLVLSHTTWETLMWG